MKDEEAKATSQRQKGDLAKKMLLKWVEKKNKSGEKPEFNVPQVNSKGILRSSNTFDYIRNRV